MFESQDFFRGRRDFVGQPFLLICTTFVPEPSYLCCYFVLRGGWRTYFAVHLDPGADRRYCLVLGLWGRLLAGGRL